METLTSVVLSVAIVTNGLLAGLFFVFAVAICPGLRAVDDRSFVTAFRAINIAIVNPLFLLVFFAGPITAVGATVLVLIPQPSNATVIWALLGVVGAVLTFFTTVIRNVPLNNALERTPIATPEQQHSAREAFETPWATRNLARTLTSVLALISYAALAVIG